MSFIAIKPEKSAKRILYLANAPNLSKISGKYFKNGHLPVSTNPFSYEIKNRTRLSKITQELIEPSKYKAAGMGNKPQT